MAASSPQEDSVSMFIAMTNCDKDTADAFLKAASWNLEVAIDRFYTYNGDISKLTTSTHHTCIPAPPMNNKSRTNKSSSIRKAEQTTFIGGSTVSTKTVSIDNTNKQVINQNADQSDFKSNNTDNNNYKNCIETELNYANNGGYSKRYNTTIDKDGNLTSDVSITTVKHKILNGRGAGCMLGSHGFQLVEQVTKLTTSDFYNNSKTNKIQDIYYKEMEEAVKKLTGAAAVVCLQYTIRNTKKDSGYRAAASHVHCDFTPYSANKTLKWGLMALMKNGNKNPNINYEKGRFCVINTWRNINDNLAIYDHHLAVCDGRSVIAPDDYLPYKIKTTKYESEGYYLNVGNHELHKWYYYPRMTKNELLIFMQYDSDWKSPSRHCFHTGIRDPTVKNMTMDVPERQSIECRLLAFFPNFEPNTIPQIGII